MRKDIQRAGSEAAARANRQRAIDGYYQNPNICLNCSSVIEVREGEKPASARRKKFCSHSCAGSYNNGAFPKRKPEGKCLQCGVEIKACLLYCSDACRAKAKAERLKNKLRKNKSESVIGWRQRMKVQALEYKGFCCQRCGYRRCVNALDFHHIDPSKKEFQIAAKICSWEKMKTELDKCLLLCANCHREFHGGVWKIEDLLPVGEVGITSGSEPGVRGS